MIYLRIALRKNLFLDSFAELFKENHENIKYIIFSFIILNKVKKGILDFPFTTATDICMKEVIHSCNRRAL